MNLDTDNIYYLRQYISPGGYSRSESNQLISNLKKRRDASDREQHYKNRAIQQFAQELAGGFNPTTSPFCMTWIPPSQSKDDPQHDDRLKQVVDKVSSLKPAFHSCEVFETSHTRPSLHFGGARRHPAEISNHLRWMGIDLNPYKIVIVVDDVLTTGASFRAVHDMIRERYASIPIVGFFWAFTVSDPDLDDNDF